MMVRRHRRCEGGGAEEKLDPQSPSPSPIEQALLFARISNVPAQLALLAGEAGMLVFHTVAARWPRLCALTNLQLGLDNENDNGQDEQGLEKKRRNTSFKPMKDWTPVEAASAGRLEILAEMAKHNSKAPGTIAAALHKKIDIEETIARHGRTHDKSAPLSSQTVSDLRKRKRQVDRVSHRISADSKVFRISADVVIAAAAAGHIDVVKWTMGNVVPFPFRECVFTAASRGNVALLRELLDPNVLYRYNTKKRDAADSRTFDFALSSGAGSFETAKLIYERTRNACSCSGVDAAARNPLTDIRIFPWLYKHFGIYPSWRSVVQGSTLRKDLKLVRWRARFALRDDKDPVPDDIADEVHRARSVFFFDGIKSSSGAQ